MGEVPAAGFHSGLHVPRGLGLPQAGVPPGRESPDSGQGGISQGAGLHMPVPPAPRTLVSGASSQSRTHRTGLCGQGGLPAPWGFATSLSFLGLSSLRLCDADSTEGGGAPQGLRLQTIPLVEFIVSEEHTVLIAVRTCSKPITNQ